MQERLELENVARWECGRPVPAEVAAAPDGANDAGQMEVDPAPAGSADAQGPPRAAAAETSATIAASGRYFDAANDDDVRPLAKAAPSKFRTKVLQQSRLRLCRDVVCARRSLPLGNIAAAAAHSLPGAMCSSTGATLVPQCELGSNGVPAACRIAKYGGLLDSTS